MHSEISSKPVASIMITGNFICIYCTMNVSGILKATEVTVQLCSQLVFW